MARESYSSYCWEEIIHWLGQRSIDFLVVIPLTRTFRQRGKIFLTIVNKMVGQSDELTCRVWSRTSVPKLKTIWCTTKVCFDPSTALTAGLNQTLSKIMCDNFSLEKCFTFTPSYFLLLLHHFTLMV